MSNFKAVPQEKNLTVEIDQDAPAFRITGSGKQAVITFNLPGQQLDGRAEPVGERDFALRAAIAQSREFFMERYQAFSEALARHPEMKAILAGIADSETLDEFEAARQNAHKYVQAKAAVLVGTASKEIN